MPTINAVNMNLYKEYHCIYQCILTQIYSSNTNARRCKQRLIVDSNLRLFLLKYILTIRLFRFGFFYTTVIVTFIKFIVFSASCKEADKKAGNYFSIKL